MAKHRWNKWQVVELSSSTDLSCGCSAFDEPDGFHGEIVGGFPGFEANERYVPGWRGNRVMRRYRDGTMRHARCGRVSNPI
jgi:hypothetical protein